MAFSDQNHHLGIDKVASVCFLFFLKIFIHTFTKNQGRSVLSNTPSFPSVPLRTIQPLLCDFNLSKLTELTKISNISQFQKNGHSLPTIFAEKQFRKKILKHLSRTLRIIRESGK